jgi:hypothetical protein
MARRRIGRALAAERRYRKLGERLAVSDTIADRAALANACCDLELFEEARRHYQDILARPYGVEPVFMVGKARAELELGLDDQAILTLDALRARWPHYHSRDAHRLCTLIVCGGGHRPARVPHPETYLGRVP